MPAEAEVPQTSHPRLEQCVKEYLELVGGVWEEVEPEVYNTLLPAEIALQLTGGNASDPGQQESMLCLTLDPEAVQDYEGAYLLTFGSPFLDRLLKHAHERTRVGHAYLAGLHLYPYDLARHIARALTLPPKVTLQMVSHRPFYFTSAIFWFQATLVSDEKEQEIVPMGVDLQHGRQIRHLEDLLQPSPPIALVETQPFLFPDVPRLSLGEGHRLAWNYAVEKIAAVANQRQREIQARLSRQNERMNQYFEDMREEIREQIARAEARGTNTKPFLDRLEAINREERVRLAELKQKSTLSVEIQLMNLLRIKQPKLQVQVKLVPDEGDAAQTNMVWDPLTNRLEALDCPLCKRPSLKLAIHHSQRVVCAECASLRG